MYTRLLKICGFEPSEIESQLPRIERAFAILEIKPEDLAQAEKRVHRFFDINLLGMRKILGIWLKELVDLVLAKEEGKIIIYSSMPPCPHLAAIAAMGSEKVFSTCPDSVLQMTMGKIFGKLTPFLEAGERHGLPQGRANCGTLQCRLGGIISGKIPVPDLLLPSGFLCDQTPKTDELLQELYGIPVISIDTTIDELADNWPVPTPRRVRYTAQYFQEAVQKIGEICDFELSEKEIAERILPRYSEICRKSDLIHSLMMVDPVPIRYENLVLVYFMTRNMLKEGLLFGQEAMDILYQELQERVEKGMGTLPKGAPRIFITHPIYCDDELFYMIAEAGLAIVTGSHMTTARERVPSMYTSLWEKLADVNLRRGSRYCGLGMVQGVKQICLDWKVDGAIVSYPYSCRGFVSYPFKAKEVLEKELGIPAMVLENDIYDIREITPEQLRNRVETFAELTKQAKQFRPKDDQ
jgi:benzoyl-CoA reductase/2-hydroxyglutaryl-CoA dehydratase subunit BcrC/BadD/HgdB